MKRSYLTGLFLAALLIISISKSVFGQEWTEPVNISNLGGYSKDPDMVIDHNGVIHVVWTFQNSAYHWLIMYTKSEDDGHTWSEPLDLLQNTDLKMSQPHIACNSKNHLYVSYTHDGYSWTPEGRLIKMLTWDGHQWTKPIVVSEGMPGSHYNNVIIDYNDRVYVFWDHGPSGDDYYRFFENNVWSEAFCPYPGGDETFALMEAVIDADNSLHWIGSSLGAIYYGERLQYFYWDNFQNTWFSPENPSNDTIQPGKDIGLDRSNNPETAYRKKSINPIYGGDATKHTKKEGTSWLAPDLVSGTDKRQVGQQIAIDQNNDVHVVETEFYASSVSETQLVHYFKVNDNWFGQAIDSSNHMCHFPTLLYNRNCLYVVYRHSNASGTGDLRFSKYDIITNIEEETNQSPKLKIYPNPSYGNVYIEFENNKQQHIKLSVLDMNGKLFTTLANSPHLQMKYFLPGSNKYNGMVQTNMGKRCKAVRTSCA